MPEDLKGLTVRIAACRICAEHLPLGPRPVVVPRPTARVLIVGQAPGTKVHESGIPWNDRSGDRLREWLGLDRETFYNSERIAIMPMGFCYPGVLPNGGDAPPRPECAAEWHDPLLAHMPEIELVVLAGMYAQAHYLGKARKKTLTETVESWREYGPRYLPLPHPSWRSGNLLKKNPWIEAEILPHLRGEVARLLG
ncbi:MAG: uracil-DNA glycosylase family protein [Nisaea sp.]|uniref:uracil-DNA glycosylase family protein n=1 Tax=Nisaea sp. TaxID=2024842 RepID=UPI001B09027B|nr:uracil-DNA glycosylase family protein [Nisaea sp.]MBO6561424.1 uracil-DNA glycosylase family protein [Nisaea sp.]